MRVVSLLIVIVVFAGLFWRFPLWHIVPLKTAATEKTAGVFKPTGFAEDFWTNRLAASLAQAVKADVLLRAIQAGPAAARAKFAHGGALGDSYFYFLSGSGRVVAGSDDEISLAVTEGSTNVEVVLEVGLVFGNAVRDGTGLLNVGDYADSQNFNDISAALNHIVETRVLPPLKGRGTVGAKISFVGCAEVDDESSDLKPLKVTPIQTATP
jgi:predicted lipoprotein